ncbi:RTA1 like protein-domain-containing protein [Podospora didyma]|uniref:RTA1 like protein-domain-containing protein n=1 Tax=Podospora didyma TaxID=330526 RepID=A0AAE0KF41_9PEZI|nr:RTA1 like protein-domain-containing protein [Podospora didyma]
MRFSLQVPLLSALLLLPLLSAASPTPAPSSSLALSTRAAVITSFPSATAPPPSRRRDRNNFDPSIPPFSLDLPPNTCTPGFSSYATPGLEGYVPADACNALWNYFPNFAAAVALSILFGILTIAHLAQAVRYRNGFCWVIVMAGFWETGAYAFRALGSKNQQSSGIALVAQILVLVAPIWVNAFVYMVFARIVHFFSPTRKVWFFSPSSLALIFVTLDIISFVIQLVGGGMAGPGASADAQKRGLNIYMGGIGMQEGFIVLFLGLVVKFHRDQLQAERVGRILTAEKVGGWKWLIWALYGCLAAITIRIIYRLAEFTAGMGTSNPLPSNEPVLYVLESTPMWLAILVWNFVHPGRFIHGEDAKTPPSWLSRHLCCCCCSGCCCCRRKRNGKFPGHAGGGAHHHPRRLAGDFLELQDNNQEMHPIILKNLGDYRVTAATAAAPANPFLDPPSSRDSSPNKQEQPLRPCPPPPAADNHLRQVSPEPPSSYTAYRPRDFLS